MINKFPFLAIESSGDLCSASVHISENSFVEMNILMKHIHSKKLVPCIHELLNEAQIEIGELKFIAISNGPGSFTGLRISLATAKGIGFGISIPICPVPTFNALAFQIGSYLSVDTEFNLLINANIEEVYFGKFKNDKSIGIPAELHLVPKSELENKLNPDSLIYGNYPFSKNVQKISSPYATSVGNWAYFFGEDLLTSDYDYLEPNYFKNFIPKVKQ